MIPDEAVQTAAQARYRAKGLRDLARGLSSGQVAWGDTTDGVREVYLEQAREVLEAAYPVLRAQIVGEILWALRTPPPEYPIWPRGHWAAADFIERREAER